MSKKKAQELQRKKEKIFSQPQTHTPTKFIILFCIASFFVGSILYLTFGKAFRPSHNEVVTSDNVASILTQMSEDEASISGSYELKLNTTWHFKNGSVASRDAYVENSSSNQNDIYFTVVLAAQPETILYVSPTLKVGACTDKIKLLTDLDTGSYEARLTYYLLDKKGDCVSTIPVKITIVVEE